MRSTFSGLELARRALQTQQKAVNVVGHNVANANTKGYSRQEVVTQATGPYTSPSNVRPTGAGQIGSGVKVESIQRQFDNHIAEQYRLENSLESQWQQKHNGMEQIEAIFNEPSDSSLRRAVDDFWSALQQMTTEPTELSSRAIVRQSAIAMVDTFQTMDRQLEQVSKDYDESIKADVSQANSKIRGIADLNERIVKIKAMGDSPNDLMDQRDVLIDELTEVINVKTEHHDNGDLTVQFPLGEGDYVTIIDGVTSGKNFGQFGYDIDVDNPGKGQLSVKEASELPIDDVDAQEIDRKQVAHGKIKGMFEAQDEVDTYRRYLTDYASEYTNAINEQHREGFDLNGNEGIDFFVNIGNEEEFEISTLAVNPAIVDELSLIAAAGKGPDEDGEFAEGNGENALAMAELRHENSMEFKGADVTFDGFYRSVVAELGISTNESYQMLENQKSLAYQFEMRQEEVRGVSLDEEMTKMIQYQHSYVAASRLTNTIDEMIDTIVNRLGVVGR
ncbi:flagellar hook-associated protein FlgK [Proteinivorax hydrogeniformans]|uniref:Flagellar hook-associated protein 1 n=1 Tax=Proteinivorax hydrogeniformans TaxID=1826727 RepID=A0AAU8HUW8_9FIRM